MINELTKELEEAKAKIAQNRLVAWSSDIGAIKFGKLTLIPLTVKAWIDLKLVGNAVVGGSMPGDADLLEYLWRNSDKYDAKSCSASEKYKQKIGFLFGKSKATELLELVYSHMHDAFVEMPICSNISNQSFSRDNRVVPVDSIVAVIDEVSARYGQNPANVLTWPLNRIFQLQKAMRLSTIPNYKLAEPQIIKTIKQKILTEINNGTESGT
tara:strand:- start:2565 stop:3200 length:636 start_codon:yes stop_codon:yes gene_type:complete